MIPSVSNINTELIKYIDWLQLNALSLNVDKTKCMIFKSPQKLFIPPPIKLRDNLIEYVDNFNFLGITIDNHLTWKEHVEKISRKISKVIGILCILKRTLPIRILHMIYNSLINPHIHYGLLCWGTQNVKILKLQKKALRTITNSKYNAHTQPLFKNLRILPVNDLYNLKLLQFYYKYMNDIIPYYFKSIIVKRQREIHNRNTRNSNFITLKSNL